jgi:hypothetical protein
MAGAFPWMVFFQALALIASESHDAGWEPSRKVRLFFFERCNFKSPRCVLSLTDGCPNERKDYDKVFACERCAGRGDNDNGGAGRAW